MLLLLTCTPYVWLFICEMDGLSEKLDCWRGLDWLFTPWIKLLATNSLWNSALNCLPSSWPFGWSDFDHNICKQYPVIWSQEHCWMSVSIERAALRALASLNVRNVSLGCMTCLLSWMFLIAPHCCLWAWFIWRTAPKTSTSTLIGGKLQSSAIT